ncbi:hypothetical protein [Nonomuraea dietziae]|uniref:hypothetical protein n=1 Tax=Nonomuraea dietziae TaxID=65515 RepID=UPI0031E3D102
MSYDVTDKVAALHVEADSGTVEVVQSDRRGIRVTERRTWLKNKPESSHKVQGDTLELTFACPTTWGWAAIGTSCDVSYQVEVPEGTARQGGLRLGGPDAEEPVGRGGGHHRLRGDRGRRAGRAGGVVTRTDSGDMNLALRRAARPGHDHHGFR